MNRTSFGCEKVDRDIIVGRDRSAVAGESLEDPSAIRSYIETGRNTVINLCGVH